MIRFSGLRNAIAAPSISRAIRFDFFRQDSHVDNIIHPRCGFREVGFDPLAIYLNRAESGLRDKACYAVHTSHPSRANLLVMQREVTADATNSPVFGFSAPYAIRNGKLAFIRAIWAC